MKKNSSSVKCVHLKNSKEKYPKETMKLKSVFITGKENAAPACHSKRNYRKSTKKKGKKRTNAVVRQNIPDIDQEREKIVFIVYIISKNFFKI